MRFNHGSLNHFLSHFPTHGLPQLAPPLNFYDSSATTTSWMSTITTSCSSEKRQSNLKDHCQLQSIFIHSSDYADPAEVTQCYLLGLHLCGPSEFLQWEPIAFSCYGGDGCASVFFEIVALSLSLPSLPPIGISVRSLPISSANHNRT